MFEFDSKKSVFGHDGAEAILPLRRTQDGRLSTFPIYASGSDVRKNAPDFPSLDDGPPKRSWSPCVAACGLGTQNGRAYKFSVKTEDGVMHRFLINRSHACWLAATFVDALFPRAGKLLAWLLYRESRKTRQSAMSSGNVKRDGSPHDGHAV